MNLNPSRLRICLPTGIFPPDIGGPASYVPRIAAALTERGHSVEVITLADDARAPLPDYPFPVHRIPRGMSRLLRMDATVHEIVRAAWRSDLIFANGLFIEAAAAAAVARRPLAMKIVGDWAWERARNRGSAVGTLEDFQRLRQPPRDELVKALRAFVTRRAGTVIAPSRYLADRIAEWGVPAGRISVVYNALEPLPETGRAMLPAFDGRTVITVARLVPWKGIGALIEWVATRPGCRLLVVGDGPERSALESLTARLGARDRVIFTGGVSRPCVAELLRASDAFVLNSAYEGLPHIVLEAFEAGVPVLAAAAGGTPEVVTDGKNGLLVPPGDSRRLATSLDNLLSDPALAARLVNGGRNSIADRFRWDLLLAQTERALRIAAASGGEAA